MTAAVDRIGGAFEFFQKRFVTLHGKIKILPVMEAFEPGPGFGGSPLGKYGEMTPPGKILPDRVGKIPVDHRKCFPQGNPPEGKEGSA